MIDFKLALAGVTVRVRSRFESLKRFSKHFLYEGENEDFSVSVTDGQIADEKKLYDYEVSDSYVESTCIYREIAELLPNYDAFVFHGAAITYNDKGYIFTAPSGTGKSTHIKLWKDFLGEPVDIVNGDKPIIKLEGDGFSVFGSPWAGKENWGKNRKAPLCALCFVEQSPTNSVKRLSTSDVVARIIKQTYRPKNVAAYLKTLELLDSMLKNVPVFLLRCDMSENAVKTSFEALTGEIYK